MQNTTQTYSGAKCTRLFLAPKSKLEAVLTVLLAAYLSFALVMGYKVSVLQSCTVGPLGAAGIVAVALLAYLALTAFWRFLDSYAARCAEAHPRTPAHGFRHEPARAQKSGAFEPAQRRAQSTMPAADTMIRERE